jgi:hypothetical protein
MMYLCLAYGTLAESPIPLAGFSVFGPEPTCVADPKQRARPNSLKRMLGREARRICATREKTFP